jgi:hypothetical protein
MDRQTHRQAAKRFYIQHFMNVIAGDTEEGEEPQSAKGLRVHEPRRDPRQDCRDAGKTFSQYFNTLRKREVGF